MDLSKRKRDYKEDFPNLTNETEFYTLDSGVTLKLLKAGWYRFNVKFLWTDLSSIQNYDIQIVKNGGVESIMHRVYTPPLDTYFVDTYAYVYSDGDDEIQVVCFNVGLADTTTISSSQIYNQFVLEYVKEA